MKRIIFGTGNCSATMLSSLGWESSPIAMTNHVHIVGIPEREDSIAKVFRDCHGAYAAEFNKKTNPEAVPA